MGATVESLAAVVAPARGPPPPPGAIQDHRKQRARRPAFSDPGPRRDRDGGEVDLVLEAPDRGIAALEIKATAAPTPRDGAGPTKLRDRLGGRFTNGVLLHLGDRVLPFSDRLTQMPLSALWAP